MPLWYNVWWVINALIAVYAIYYIFTARGEISKLFYIWIIYANLWGLWAAKFRKKNNNKS